MSAARRRGQPLAVLGFVLASWIGVRAAVWEPPFALPTLPGMVSLPGMVEASPGLRPAPNVPRQMAARAPDAESGAVVAGADLPAASPR